MSLNTLNELQKQAKSLRSTSGDLENYAKTVAKKRQVSILPDSARPFEVRVTQNECSYEMVRVRATEAEFQKAIAPFEDHILAIMEIGFRTQAKRAMMQAEAIEARIAASITIPEPLP